MTEAPSIKEALEAIEPYLDAITCYASSVDEHEGNRVAKMVRTALATFQPDGERREAIARILERIINRRVLQDRIDGYTLETSVEMADIILASGLVQDEAGWRDISTAPKDGTEVLIYGAKDNEPPKVHQASFTEGYWFDQYGKREDPYVGERINATHWMPLPAPPIRSARDGGAES